MDTKIYELEQVIKNEIQERKIINHNICYFTVGQHIEFRKYNDKFKKLNIKYIFTPHKNTKNFLNISFVSDKIFTEKIILYRKLEIEKKLKFIISTLTYQKYMKMNQMYLNVFRDEIIVENKSGVNIKLQNMLINQIAITTEVLQSEIIDKNTMLICKTIDKYNFLGL